FEPGSSIGDPRIGRGRKIGILPIGAHPSCDRLRREDEEGRAQFWAPAPRPEGRPAKTRANESALRCNALKTRRRNSGTCVAECGRCERDDFQTWTPSYPPEFDM